MRRLTLLYPLIIPTPYAGETFISRFLLLLALIVVAVAGTFIQLDEFRKARLYQSEGVIVATESISKYSRCHDLVCTYSIDYTFVARPSDGGRRYSDDEHVPRVFYNSVATGAPLQVIYLASSPDTNRLYALYVPGQSSYVGAIVGGLLFLPLFVVWLWQTLDAQNARRLDNEGLLVVSAVAGRCTQENLTARPNYYRAYRRSSWKNDDVDRGPNYVFKNSYYIVYDLPGVGLVRSEVDKNTYDRMHDGSPIHLRYLPDNPRICRVEWEMG